MDTHLDQRLARLEAIQADHATRIGRMEASPERPPQSASGSGRWQRIGIIVLGGLALFWLLDELPGPPIWDRLF